MRELWLRIAQTGATKVYTVMLGVVTLALTARWLGPDGRGQFVAVWTWMGLFVTIGHLSLGQVAINRAGGKRDENWPRNATGSLLVMTGLASAACWVVSGGLYLVSEGAIYRGLSLPMFVIGMAALPLYIWELHGSALLMAAEKIDIYNRAQIIGRTVGVFLIVPFIGWAQWGVAGALTAIILGQAVLTAGLTIFLVKPRINATLAEIKALLAGGVKLHLNAVGAFAFTSADILILNYYRGPEETAYYQFAAQLIASMMIMPQAATAVLYGKVAAIGADAAWPHQKKLLKQTMLMVSAGAAVAWVLAPWLITWFAGTRFMPSIEIFRWLLLSLIGMTFSGVMTAQWIGRGLFLQASGFTLLLAGINLGINLTFVPTYGMIAAVVAQLATHFASAIVNVCMAIHCERSWSKACGRSEDESKALG